MYVSLTVSPIRNSAGRIVGASKIVRDVTARKRTEEALARQADELAKSNLELARHAEELARSNVELERFAYVASHDLQEPMRTVQSFAQLLDRKCGDSLEGEAEEFLRFIVGGVQRMQTLINDLLAYSRVSSEGAKFAPADCKEICIRVLENLRASIDANQANVTVDPLPVVIGDATQLGQVLQNLLGQCHQVSRPADASDPRIRERNRRASGFSRSWITGSASRLNISNAYSSFSSDCTRLRNMEGRASGWRSARRSWSDMVDASG